MYRVLNGLIAGAFVLAACTSGCSPASKKKTERDPGAVTDSLAQSDLKPVKTMPDTLRISSLHPLIVTDRAHSDSVALFPYSLLFRQKNYAAFVVSFNDFSPTLVTLDKSESIIDSMTLIGILRTEHPGLAHHKRVTIRSPLEIVSTDSVTTWDPSLSADKIKSTRKVEVVTTRFQIDDTGRIIGRE